MDRAFILIAFRSFIRGKGDLLEIAAEITAK